jgi:hypothetical protein
VFDGRSLLPLARRPRAFKNRDILIENGPSDGKAPQYDAIRTPRYLFAEYVKTDERELYDLRRDRHELRSRHASRDTRPCAGSWRGGSRRCATARDRLPALDRRVV